MTRAELYELVWRNPAVHVAKQLGVSNARLRKVCEDYGVPLPPAGYWTKRAYGVQAPPPPLPQQAPTLLSRFNSALRRFGEVPLQFAEIQINEFELAGNDQASHDAASESASRALSERLGSATEASDGMLELHEPPFPSVTIGRSLIGRTVAVFNALALRCGQHGYAWIATDDGQRIVAQSEPFEIKLYEVRGRNSGEQPSDRSGRLCLEIVDPRPFRWGHRNLVGQWYDLPSKPIESCLAEILTAIAAATSVIKSCRASAASEAAILADDAERNRLEALAGERTERRKAFLLEKAQAYAGYRQLVEFAAHLETIAQSEGLRSLLQDLIVLIAERKAEFEKDALEDQLSRVEHSRFPRG